MTLKLTRAAQAVLLLSLLAFTSTGYGQTDKNFLKKIYLLGGTGPTSHSGYMAQLGVQAVLKNNWTTTLSYYNTGMNPKNLPADYEQGYTVIIVLPIPDGYPDANVNFCSLTAGRYFEVGRRFWATTEAGLSLVKGEELSFSRQEVIFTFLGHVNPNYAATTKERTTVGAVLKADFTWAFSSFAGLSAGAFANFNSVQSPVGGELKLVVGWMNRKPRK